MLQKIEHLVEQTNSRETDALDAEAGAAEGVQADDILANERDLLRALLDNSPDHIYFKDTQSRFIRSSTAQALQFGMKTADGLVGKSDFDVFSEEHARPAFEDEQEIIRTGVPMIGKVEKETWIDGRPDTWALTTKMPLRNRHGDIIGTFGITKDISELKHAERQIADVHAQLLEASRVAGMAEIATNVLHNVGNVLNSVNVSADLVSARLRASKVKGLARAVQLMDSHAHDLGEFLTSDAKGKLVPGYLRELALALESDHEIMTRELGLLGKSVEHIKEVVAIQQSYAGASRVVESLRFDELLDDALRMNAEALSRHKVGIVKNLGELPALPLDRHRLLQILVNLISNAKHAMNHTPNQNQYITFGAELVDAEAGRVLRIMVADNGEGIAPENLIRVFAHGFTTRKDGHGFGLHSCVLAAQEMGGSLTAHSDGPGHGATFTLEVPIDATKGPR
jgi:PAS domain S-box-containing protein